MNINVLYLIGYLPVPIIIMIIGFSIWKCPPNFNENFGYRTKRSTKNEHTWRAAQLLYGKYSALAFAPTAAVTLIVGIFQIIKNFGEIAGLVTFTAVTAAQISVLIAVIIAVESRLKKLFDGDGNPKGGENFEQ